jgi:hypothetical protein
MTTPRNSVSGIFPVEPTKGPIGMQPAQKVNLGRMSSVVSPMPSFFMRELKALGVSWSPSVPHPRDSLACSSYCYRSSIQSNLKGSDPSMLFMSDKWPKSVWYQKEDLDHCREILCHLWFKSLRIFHPSPLLEFQTKPLLGMPPCGALPE